MSRSEERLAKRLERFERNKQKAAEKRVQYQQKLVQMRESRKQTPESKVCSGCFKEKPASEFTKRSASTDGLFNRCNDCMSEAKARNKEIRSAQLVIVRAERKAEKKAEIAAEVAAVAAEEAAEKQAQLNEIVAKQNARNERALRGAGGGETAPS
jgi:hypothetical protein